MNSLIQDAFSTSPFALTLLTNNLEASKKFYGQTLQLDKVFEDEVSAVYRCGSTVINILEESAAADLVSPASIGDANGIRAVYTLKCQDIDGAANQLVAAGVKLLNGPVDRPWGVRTVSFQDPSGHTWELANH